MELIIKHFFNWDSKKQESNGVGLFGELLAWCLAKEVLGCKSLHGHYLVFIKIWSQVMNQLQQRKNQTSNNISLESTRGEAKLFFANACSTRLFSDFASDKPLNVIMKTADWIVQKRKCNTQSNQ